LLAGFSFFILKERGKSETARKQSDELLLNILPNEIATELKATGTTTAKHYNNVTVLFTDFVNFTQAAEQMNAQGLIDELHACFKMFDEITAKYNIEKIKTIGDAYLAVCGLPTADPKHAENIVRAAKEITMFMEDRLGKMGVERTFQVRVGVHSGSVVAGIVGVKKFAYDIWGDTVNTAARMEQHGEAGKINISETTYDLVKDKFSCEYRGEVEAKGKGVMRMYFVG
jgi:adenylate cyclase